MDNIRQIGPHLQNVSHHTGWEVIQQHLDKLATRARTDLETKSFSDLGEVRYLQGQIDGYKAAKIYLQDRLRAYTKALQEEDKR